MEAVNFPFALGEEEAADNGLVKLEFHYQLHDRIQWGNMLCVVLASVLTWYFHMRLELSLWLCAVCLIALSVLLLAVFSLFQSLKIFRAVGHCWRDGDKIMIECGENEYRIASVKEMVGSETRFFFAKCAKLSITTERDIFDIFSIPLNSEEKYEDSSTYPLCQLVLGSFPYLQAVELPGQKTKHRYVRIDK